MVQTKITIAFFGITRSLRFTIDSIRDQIIAPAKKIGQVMLVGHFFRQSHVLNSRSGENGSYPIDEYKLLGLDDVLLEEPNLCLDLWGFDKFTKFGDHYSDDFRSLKNLFHQLHSLRKVTAMAMRDRSDIVIFARPDLYYHDSFVSAINDVLCCHSKTTALPNWQWWSGVNDRFALCTNSSALAYGNRIEMLEQYFHDMKRPLSGEKLLKYSLKRNSVSIMPVPLRASRVRIDGKVKTECFDSRSSRSTHRLINWVKDFLTSSGLVKRIPDG